MSIGKYVSLLGFLLFLALFFERYFFAVAIYKTRNYGYILILLVIFLNTVFLYAIKRLRTKKQKKKLYELYDIERAPKVNTCFLIIIG